MVDDITRVTSLSFLLWCFKDTVPSAGFSDLVVPISSGFAKLVGFAVAQCKCAAAPCVVIGVTQCLVHQYGCFSTLGQNAWFITIIGWYWIFWGYPRFKKPPISTMKNDFINPLADDVLQILALLTATHITKLGFTNSFGVDTWMCSWHLEMEMSTTPSFPA